MAKQQPFEWCLGVGLARSDVDWMRATAQSGDVSPGVKARLQNLQGKMYEGLLATIVPYGKPEARAG